MQHVIPLNDLKKHELTQRCDCDPVIDWDRGIVIHNAYDKREEVEKATGKSAGPDKKWKLVDPES